MGIDTLGPRRRWTLVGLCLIRLVVGQTTNTTCNSNSTTSWLFNTNGESPCAVWSRIQSLCLSSDNYVNVPPLLDPSWAYNPPPSSGQTICQCNLISYNLMAGCSWCQVGDTNNWATEQNWKDTCGDQYTSDGLGFAESVQVVPAYAWRQWNGGQWAPAQASASASSFTTLTPTGTTTLSRSLPPITSSSTKPTGSSAPSASSSTNGTSSDPNSSEPKEKSTAAKWGLIVGGVAGGVFALVLLFLLIRYLSSNKKKNQIDPNTVIKYDDPEKKRSRTQSFMNIFGAPSPRSRDRGMKRQTEFITDPTSFAHPRPAPKAPVGEGGRYVTTTQRLRGKRDSDSSEEEQFASARPHQRLIVHNADDDDSLEDLDEREISKNPKGRNLTSPRTPSQDFSQPRPFSEVQTLPSLYDPPTGAPRYTMQSDMTGSTAMERVPLSPESRYPATERQSRASTIGEALGSGRRPRHDQGYWSRQELPPLPRNVSDDSDRY